MELIELVGLNFFNLLNLPTPANVFYVNGLRIYQMAEKPLENGITLLAPQPNPGCTPELNVAW
jgi:hypothetical protein